MVSKAVNRFGWFCHSSRVTCTRLEVRIYQHRVFRGFRGFRIVSLSFLSVNEMWTTPRCTYTYTRIIQFTYNNNVAKVRAVCGMQGAMKQPSGLDYWGKMNNRYKVVPVRRYIETPAGSPCLCGDTWTCTVQYESMYSTSVPPYAMAT